LRDVDLTFGLCRVCVEVRRNDQCFLLTVLTALGRVCTKPQIRDAGSAALAVLISGSALLRFPQGFCIGLDEIDGAHTNRLREVIAELREALLGEAFRSLRPPARGVDGYTL
jgi:hypothetical protein